MGKRLLAIVGPTAVGKSALALRLAKKLNGELVSADSRQVYRHMDVGTAKPSLQERSVVQHHLIDVVGPDQEYNLAIFLRQASAAINLIHRRSKLPIVVGGTGQYVWALLEGWSLPEVPPDAELRRSLAERATADGPGVLYKELARADPASASRIDPRNVRRVIRALEVHYATRGSGAAPVRRVKPPHRTKIIGLTVDRPILYDWIDARVDRMIGMGWVEEVKVLLKRGYDPNLPSLSGLGYRELVRHLRGEMPVDSAVEQIKRRTHRFSRSQLAWFRRADERILWCDVSDGLFAAELKATAWTES